MYFNPLAIIVTVVGLYLLFRLKFFYLIHPIKIIKKTLGALKDGASFRSLSLALAGTLGVGNILGVAVGLILGGPGSLLWMLVSAIFAMVLKYSEITLCRSQPVHFSDGTHGGMAYVVRSSFGSLGGALAFVYALSTILLSLTMGSSLQLVSVSGISAQIFNTPPYLILFLFVLLVAAAILGGTKVIKKITAICIPLTTIIYIILTLSIIVIRYSSIPEVFLLIFDDAFSLDGIAGGILGFILSGSVREGFCRGILSNEAGAGTSSTAHSASGILSPSACGLMGIVEVFFDTALLCPLTGLAILVCIPDITGYATGMELINATFFMIFGSVGTYLLFFCILIFAYSTVVCWYYYGKEATAFLFGYRSAIPYTLFFLLALPLCTFFGELILISITDILLLILTLICCAALLKNSDRVVALSESGGITSRHRLFRLKGNVSLTKR